MDTKTLITVAVGLFAAQGAVQADTTVALLTIQEQSAYTTTRTYAGRSVAGRASELGFKRGGEVAEIAIDIGDAVAEGDLIARLDTRSWEAALAQARANVQLAAANLQAVEAETQLARQTERRFRSLRESGHTSEQLYDEQRLALRAKSAQVNVAKANLQSAKAAQLAAEIVLHEARIYAPFSGTIQARYLDEGSQTAQGAAVVRLVETARIEAHIGLPQKVARSLTPEAEYQIFWEDRHSPAQLIAVLPEIDPASRTVTAVLNIDALDIPLGAVVELELRRSVPALGFWVPVAALTESDRGLWGVYVVNDQAKVERRVVEIIHTESERAYVRGTLEDADRIVRTGVQRIVPGQQVTTEIADSSNTGGG